METFRKSRTAGTRTVAVALLAGALLIGSASALAQGRRKFERFDTEGVGNCLFSTQPLPRLKPQLWRPQTTFEAPRDKVIYARCLFKHPIRHYAKLGVMIPQVLPTNSTRRLRGPDAFLTRHGPV